MLGSTGTALVGIATALSAVAFLLAIFRLMAHAHNPRRRQQEMQMLADASVMMILLFGITTVVGIFATVYLHF
jgi:ABC-type phosphate transport system permease subunit